MWKTFHHPDVSLPVVRRRIGLELVEMLGILGDVAIYGARAFLFNRTRPNSRALDQAVGRLERQGLIVLRKGLDTPVLRLAEDAAGLLDDYFFPEKFWNRKWSGIWYLLMYDIPEKDRHYRNTVRQFLKRQRMGCFQKSVWIASRDIRPQYADLDEGAALGAFACLFEARTVLGMAPEQVVAEAWNFDRLYEIQKRFCEVYSSNLQILNEAVSMNVDALMQLAFEELSAYRSAMVLDPLLPDRLLPADYKGKEVYRIHREAVDAIRQKLADAKPD